LILGIFVYKTGSNIVHDPQPLNTIIKIEAGKNQNPTLDTLKKIAKVLKVSVDGLIK